MALFRDFSVTLFLWPTTITIMVVADGYAMSESKSEATFRVLRVWMWRVLRSAVFLDLKSDDYWNKSYKYGDLTKWSPLIYGIFLLVLNSSTAVSSEGWIYCPRVAPYPYWLNGPITQLSPSLTRDRCTCMACLYPLPSSACACQYEVRR